MLVVSRRVELFGSSETFRMLRQPNECKRNSASSVYQGPFLWRFDWENKSIPVHFAVNGVIFGAFRRIRWYLFNGAFSKQWLSRHLNSTYNQRIWYLGAFIAITLDRKKLVTSNPLWLQRRSAWKFFKNLVIQGQSVLQSCDPLTS